MKKQVALATCFVMLQRNSQAYNTHHQRGVGAAKPKLEHYGSPVALGGFGHDVSDPQPAHQLFDVDTQHDKPCSASAE